MQTQTERNINLAYSKKLQKVQKQSCQKQKQTAASAINHYQSTEQTDESWLSEGSGDFFTNINTDIQLLNSSQSHLNAHARQWIPWTELKIKQLVKLFERHEPQWQLIKDKDAQHSHEAKLLKQFNVDLKDHIWNLKNQYLRYVW